MRLDWRRKVFYGTEFLVWTEERLCKCDEIEPLVLSPLQQPIMEIVSVDVGDDTLHLPSFRTVRRPEPRGPGPAPLRLSLAG